jgi:hypothetical protein
MNKQTPKQFKARKPFNRYAITDVWLHPKTYIRLTDGERKILNAFDECIKETQEFPLTSDVAKKAKIANKTWVSEQLMKLVCYGLIGSYQKNNKRMWCDRKTAKKNAKSIKQKCTLMKGI